MRRLSFFMMAVAIVSLAAVGLMAGFPASSWAITYDINRATATGGGTVVGTIETDGMIGVLSTGNIIDWDLVIDDALGSPFNLLGPLSGNNSARDIIGMSFSATATQLLWDPTINLAKVLFQAPSIGSGQTFWCLQGADNNAPCGAVVPVEAIRIPNAGFIASTDFQAATVLQVIGTVAAGAPIIPEPSTIFLFGTGLAGLVAWRMRKAKA